jgi:hypothetical protein
MQVVYQQEESGSKRIVNSFVLARDAAGATVRKTDIVLSDEDLLRGFQRCFDDRDRLAIDKATNDIAVTA